MTEKKKAPMDLVKKIQNGQTTAGANCTPRQAADAIVTYLPGDWDHLGDIALAKIGGAIYAAYNTGWHDGNKTRLF